MAEGGMEKLSTPHLDALSSNPIAWYLIEVAMPAWAASLFYPEKQRTISNSSERCCTQ